MKQKQLLALISAGLMSLGLTNSADAALVSRLGGLSYYDTDADLTWLADANYAQTTGYDADGQMTWQVANDWAAQLIVGGVGGWRLPDTIDVGNDGTTYENSNYYTGVDAGYNMTTHSELSNMFYNVLNNTPVVDSNGVETGCSAPPNYCLTNTGPFVNLKPDVYWSATEYAPYTDKAWDFFMYVGYQLYHGKNSSSYAWAVQSGDVGGGFSGGGSTVPIPAAVWLFGSGLLGLVGFARRKT